MQVSVSIRIKDIKQINILHNDDTYVISGYCQTIRKLSKLTFIVLRDHTYLNYSTDTLQCIVPAKYKFHCPHESYVSLQGKFKLRDQDKQTDETYGNIEFIVSEIKTINQCKHSFDIHNISTASDPVRFKYRYLDLRTSKMRDMLITRSKLLSTTHSFFTEQGFCNITTPILNKATPEGAKDFIVPSSNQPGKAYGLPQSPQLLKQTIICSGVDRYYQLAHCFRDEGIRSNRQVEFIQVDLEMTCNHLRDIQNIVESYVKCIVQKVLHEPLNDIPVMTYQTAIDLYGDDKPDLRIEGLTFQPTQHVGIKQLQYELQPPEAQIYLDQLPGLKYQKPYFIGPVEQLRELRLLLARDYQLYRVGLYPVWIIDFPMFTLDEHGKYDVVHHPFTACTLDNNISLLDIKSKQLDLVINGQEVGGGSLRQCDPQKLQQVLNILGYENEHIQSRFGFLLNALNSGIPQHGGFALGFERLLMLLTNESDIRNVIPFPKSHIGQCYLTEAPDCMESEHLQELKLTIVQ